jgi:hypothetical protein
MMNRSPNRTVLGKASMWTGTAACVLSCVLVALLATEAIWREPNFERLSEWPGALCGALFLILDLVTFGCGIAARRTIAGKRGLWFSAFAWYPEVTSWSSFGFPFILLMLLLITYVNRLKPGPRSCSSAAPTAR